MSHVPGLPLPSESAVLENVISTNVAQDESSAFATSAEKERLMRIGKEELEKKLKEQVKAIKIAAQAQRAALRERERQMEEVELADTAVCEIHMKRGIEKLREEIYGERTVPGPIRKLPGEMLSTIFLYHVEEDRSPWILAKVCKKWMHMAMRTPQLWCHLLVLHPSNLSKDRETESYVVNGRKELSVGRMQLCHNISQLQAAINRSGAVLPLSLKIADQYTLPSGMIVSILLRFITHPLSERLGNLHIGSVVLKSLESVTPTTIGKFPLLRSMHLPYSDAPCISKILESVSVTSTALEMAFFRWGIHPMPTVYSFWSRLKYIKVGTHPLDTTGLNQVVDQLVALESLEGPVYGWPDHKTPRAVLRNIREITLNCFPPHLGCLRLPQLETLKFRWYEGARQYTLDQSEQLSYPKLVNLEVSTSVAEWHFYTAGAFPAVRNFTFSCGDDDIVINTLEAMPSVRNVTLIGSNDPAFGIPLFKALQSSDEPVLCPNLEQLSLGDGVCTARSRLTPWIKKAIRFRKTIDRPLQGVTVTWRNKEVTVFPGIKAR